MQTQKDISDEKIMKKLTDRQKEFILNNLAKIVFPSEEKYIKEQIEKYNRVIIPKSSVSYETLLKICSLPELGGSPEQAEFLIKEWNRLENLFQNNPEQALIEKNKNCKRN